MDRPLELLFDTLLGDLRGLAKHVREVMQSELPVYGTLSPKALDNEVELEIRRVLQAARDRGGALDKTELVELAAIGKTRAQQGVPLADVLHAWIIGIEATIERAREVGRLLSIEDVRLLEFVQMTVAWCDIALSVMTTAHREADFFLAHAERSRHAAFVRAVIFGEMPTAELTSHAKRFSIDPTSKYIAFRARVDAAHELERQLNLGGLCVLADGDIAGFLNEPPSGNVSGVIGYGSPRPLDRLADSYHLATRVLTTALAFGLHGAYDAASLGVRLAVALDTDVGELLRKRYLEPLATSGSAHDLASTLRAYLACNLRVEQTAERLSVHQNTVRYRLTRFEELTGANLRNTDVVVEVWWALERSAMTS